MIELARRQGDQSEWPIACNGYSYPHCDETLLVGVLMTSWCGDVTVISIAALRAIISAGWIIPSIWYRDLPFKSGTLKTHQDSFGNVSWIVHLIDIYYPVDHGSFGSNAVLYGSEGCQKLDFFSSHTTSISLERNTVTTFEHHNSLCLTMSCLLYPISLQVMVHNFQ